MSGNLNIFDYDPKFSFSVDGMSFGAKDPLPAEEGAIEVEAMRRLGFPPLESVRSEVFAYATACATCNALITSVPEHDQLRWFQKQSDWFAGRDASQVLRIHESLLKALAEHRRELKKNRGPQKRQRSSKKRRQHNKPVPAPIPDLSAERVE